MARKPADRIPWVAREEAGDIPIHTISLGERVSNQLQVLRW